jgi:hypothetical protein
MALLDGYFAPRQFGEGGGLLGRLLALQAQQDQYQPATGFAASASAPQAAQQIAWPNPPVDGLPSGEQAGAPNLNSQYRALRSVLGDHKAMLATVNPESRKALVAQALAGQQGFHTGDNGGGAPVVSDAFPDPVRPGSQYAGRADVARAAIKGGKALFDAIAATLGKIILDNQKAGGPGSDPEKIPKIKDPGSIAPEIPSVPTIEDPGSIAPYESPAAQPAEPDPDCKQEREDALKICSEPWKDSHYDTGPYPTESGRPWTMSDCMKGFMHQRCGGNLTDKPTNWTPVKRAKRNKRR